MRVHLQTDDLSIVGFHYAERRSMALVRTSDGLGVCVLYTNQRDIPTGQAYALGEPNGFDAAIQHARTVPSRTVIIHHDTMEPTRTFP